MMEFHARGPQGDRDFGSFPESQSESNSRSDDPSASTSSPGHDEGTHGDDTEGGAISDASADSAPGGERRRRRRGGRGRRGGRAEAGASPAPIGFDAELAVEPPLPEAEFPPFDSRGAPPEVEGGPDEGGNAVHDPARKRRRRGRRGRGRGGEAQARDGRLDPQGSDDGPWPADVSLAPAQDAAPGDATLALEHPADPLTSAQDSLRPGGGQGKRRSRRGGRGRRRSARSGPGGSDGPEEQGAEAPEQEGQRARSQPRVANSDRGPAGPGKRRRRGSRGGRDRNDAPRQQETPVGVEQIPFEEDDFPQAAVQEAPPRAASRRKRHDRSREEDGETRVAEEREAPKPQLRRKNVILVNAADREEIRVAVVEGQQIVDFQMNVRKHKLLVNDIYRGRVVNLEPAIGAAFVDFGQGRNGFLHTSDVLSVYGEKDFTLQKLLTAKIDPDEWDRDDAQTDTVAPPREVPVPHAPPPAAAEHGESASAPENGEEFAEIVDDHHELHVAEAARVLRAEAQAHADHEHAAHHDELFSFDREEAPADLDEAFDGPAATELPELPEATIEVGEAGFEPAEAPAAELAEEPVAGHERDQRGRRSLRKVRGAARATQGGQRGRHGQQNGGNGMRRQARPRLPITELLDKGQVVVVQITKDAIGEKGPTLTTYISIPGRHLVLMPSMARTGVSRKIEDEKERRRLKKILTSLDNLPPGMGVIVRTAGVGCSREDLQRDLDYLLALWADFEAKLNLGRGPAPLYEESDVAIRTVRDLFNSSTEAVIVDDPEVFQRVREFTAKLMTEGDLERI
ncbi:MAG TPA: ribonuclease E/G, partial [Planctomycetota bacterium]|nr:ribonuclease E/G [Planctomycetota bacterium]